MYSLSFALVNIPFAIPMSLSLYVSEAFPIPVLTSLVIEQKYVPVCSSTVCYNKMRIITV